MDFLNSNPLYVSLAAVLVLLVAGLLWWGCRRRRRMVEGLTGPVMAERLTVSLDRSRRRLRQILLVASLVLIAVAGARPWWGYRLVEAPSRSRDVLIAVDCSRSMLAEDVSPSRLAHAKWWIREVVSASPGDRFGLIAFAGSAFLECPLTQDRNTLFQFLGDLDTSTIPVGGTNVEEALATAREAFEGAEGPHRAVILISDGGEQQGRASAELERLREAGIPVFVAGVGDPTQRTPIRTEEGKYVRDSDGEIVETTLHESMLRGLAAATSGVYVRSTSVKPNTEPVVRRVRKLLPEQHDGSRSRRPRERYQFPLALAVVLLLLRLSVGERKFAARLAAACLLAGVVLPCGADARQPDIAELEAPGAGSDHAEAEMAEQAAALEEQLARAEGREAARLMFNLGVLKHRLEELEEAESRYFQAMDRAEDDGEIASRAAQNLGALKQQQADAVMMENPDQALEILERAQSHNLEALRRNPDNEGAARNQERILNRKNLARKLKKLREQLEQQQNDALKKTEQAENEQKNANQTSDPSEQKQKQQQAEQRTQEAQETIQKLKETARQADDQKTQQRAQAAEEALKKARQAQRRDQGEKAEKHLAEARNKLARNDENDGDSQQKKPEEGDSQDSRTDDKDETGEGNDANEDGEDESASNGRDKSAGENPASESDSAEEGEGQSAAADEIGEDVARSLLLQMLEEEKELRDALKEHRDRNRKLEPVEKDW